MDKICITSMYVACTCMYMKTVNVEGFRKLCDPGKGNLEKKNFCAGSMPSGAYLRK
mgnify:CR=1 FL=1